MKNLKRPVVLAVFLLTVVVSMALGQENKNRRGDGSSAPSEAGKIGAPSKTETQLKDEQANAPSDSNREAARKARQERHRRNP